MTIKEIWRYPVKSMQGESLLASTLGERGIAGDRAFALRTSGGRTGSAKNPSRFGKLFQCRAWVDAEGVGWEMPGGTYRAGDPEGDAALSEWIGEAVVLRSEPPESPAIDYVDLEAAPLEFDAMAGTFFDTAPVHILSTGDLELLAAALPEANLDVRRFRPNLFVEAGPLTELAAGVTLRFGEVEIVVEGPCPRCIMTTLAQPDGIPRDVEVLKTLAREFEGNFGVLARVARPGDVQVGDSANGAG